MRDVSGKWAYPKHDVQIFKNPDIFFHGIRDDPDIPAIDEYETGEPT